MPAADEGLVEREAELRALDGVLAAGPSTAPAVALVAGPAGIGKTRLLDVVAGRARDFTVLRAQGAEPERDLAWGVVRQLFAPVVREPGDLFAGAARLALTVLGLDSARSVAGDALSAHLHGLYWLTANLAERGPLLLIVDDLHWADPASGRFVDYLSRRLADLPVALVVAVRSGDPGARTRTRVLRALREVVVIEPRPLTVAGTGRVLADVMEREPEGEFAAACHAVTAGNPYLLGELGGQLARDGIPPVASRVDHVRRATPQSVSHSVLLRLSRLPSDARRLAEAVAVLGGSVALAHAGALAGLDAERAATVADALAAAEVLAPGGRLSFVHPLVRTAVYNEMPAQARSAAHARAARLLAETDTDAAANQLLQTEPAGDPWVVDTLAAAAASARDRGAPDEAIARLRRALEEPPADERRAGLLLALGMAEFSAAAPSFLAHIEEAYALTTDPVARAATAEVMAGALVLVHSPLKAFEVARRARVELASRDRELDLRLEAARLTLAWHDSRIDPSERRLAPDIDPAVTGATMGEQILLTALGADVAFSGRAPARVGVELIERGMADGRFLANVGADSVPYWQALYILQAADALDFARHCLRAGEERARAQGSTTALAMAATFGAHDRLLRGALRDAEAEADLALDLNVRAGAWPHGRAAMLYLRLEALIAQGRLGEADAGAAHLEELDGPLTSVTRLFPFCARGLLRTLQGRYEDALADLLYVGECSTSAIPGVFPWRCRAAAALDALGRHEEAGALVEEDAVFARAFDTPRAVGANLRAAGLLAAGDEAIELLTESAAVLEACPSRLERARSLVALGSALRRRGRRAEAVPPLREALDLAERSGAVPLAERARRELEDAGARPHRPARFGRDQLTPSELRVARMAADGASNKQIAETLFVSLRTVETHLTHAYGKLGVRARPALGPALAARFPAEQDRIAS